jgi:hypothetical protein
MPLHTSKPVKKKGVKSFYRNHMNEMIADKLETAIRHLERVPASLEVGAVGDAHNLLARAQSVTTDLLLEVSLYLGAHMQRYQDDQKKLRKKKAQKDKSK